MTSTITIGRGTKAEQAMIIAAAHAAMQIERPDRRLVREAKALYTAFGLERYGYSSDRDLLTPPGAQPKTKKNRVKTYTLMMVPERGLGAGGVNMCPWASRGCAGSCLAYSGQGGMNNAQQARACRTEFLLEHPQAFGEILANEVRNAVKRDGGHIGLRLNCLSDLRWELAPALVHAFSAIGVTMYDYTAAPPEQRFVDDLPYHLTYSAKETHSVEDIRALVDAGHNVAVPFLLSKKDAMITEWHGMPVIDGDLTDYRPDDPLGVIVGLREKVSRAPGKTGAVGSGFIRDPRA